MADQPQSDSTPTAQPGMEEARRQAAAATPMSGWHMVLPKAHPASVAASAPAAASSVTATAPVAPPPAAPPPAVKASAPPVAVVSGPAPAVAKKPASAIEKAPAQAAAPPASSVATASRDTLGNAVPPPPAPPPTKAKTQTTNVAAVAVPEAAKTAPALAQAQASTASSNDIDPSPLAPVTDVALDRSIAPVTDVALAPAESITLTDPTIITLPPSVGMDDDGDDDDTPDDEGKIEGPVKPLGDRYVDRHKKGTPFKLQQDFIRDHHPHAPKPISPFLTAATITSQFGDRKHPILGYHKFHEGLDMIASNLSVVAPMSGFIEVDRDPHGAEGVCITIYGEDNRKYSMLHLREGSIPAHWVTGAWVDQGQLVGVAGHTGHYKNGKPSAKGVHLHLAVSEYKGDYLSGLDRLNPFDSAFAPIDPSSVFGPTLHDHRYYAKVLKEASHPADQLTASISAPVPYEGATKVAAAHGKDHVVATAAHGKTAKVQQADAGHHGPVAYTKLAVADAHPDDPAAPASKSGHVGKGSHGKPAKHA